VEEEKGRERVGRRRKKKRMKGRELRKCKIPPPTSEKFNH